MKTVSTKLENKDFDRLMEMCNEEGECISESLRDMIMRDLDAFEDGKESEKTEPKEETGTKPIPKAKIIAIDGVPVSEIKNPKIVEI